MKRIVCLLCPLLVGAALGAALGYYPECTDGSCPLHPTWWKGAIVGIAIAAVAVAIFRRTRCKNAPEISTS
jgi:hypothetical protein